MENKDNEGLGFNPMGAYAKVYHDKAAELGCEPGQVKLMMNSMYGAPSAEALDPYPDWESGVTISMESEDLSIRTPESDYESIREHVFNYMKEHGIGVGCHDFAMALIRIAGEVDD